MDIILLLAIIFILVGVVLLLAGHLVPTVPPGAVSAGWGLLGLGVLLLIVWVIVGAVDESDVGHGDNARSSWSYTASCFPFPLLFSQRMIQRRRRKGASGRLTDPA